MTRYRATMLFSVFLLSVTACDRHADEALPVEHILVELPCDVSEGCTLTAPGLTAKLVMGPDRHVLRPFPVKLEIATDLAIEQVTLGASMKGMDMGLNRYQLTSDDGKTWNARVTLPVCVSARTDWIALFELVGGGKRMQFQVSFSLDK